ncbi:hypothetical protein [Mycobacterium avium]|uniref:hypothetical protein n=1 Tax=Mycobacterium avium TaxID=1764 RepID=UPI001CC75C54|nr:hypothetical protein [Mycobacterium avium]MBZ4581103.1 hypothetical protein [Mycobacterium avium subsp. hominissuis]MBZ4609026.1 hypothetical protein [Mycobacterium avium subsp. hominissuis]
MGVIQDANHAPITPQQAQPVYPARVSGETPVAQSYSAITNANEQLGRYVEQVEKSKDRYTPEGLAEQLSAFANTDAARAVEEYTQRVTERVEQAQAAVDEARGKLVTSPDVASQLAAQRLWDRQRRLLDALDGGALASTASAALKSADPAALATLVEELPSYVQSRGVPVDFLEPVIESVAPELGKARRELSRARQAETITKHNSRVVREAIQHGRPAAPGTLADPSRYDPDQIS